MSSYDWVGKAHKLVIALSAVSKENWSIETGDQGLILCLAGAPMTGHISAILICYLLGGIMLGKGIKAEDYEAAATKQEISLSLKAQKAFGTKAPTGLN